MASLAGQTFLPDYNMAGSANDFSSFTNALYCNQFSPSFQFRKGFKKMVLGLGCTIATGKKPQDMTIEGYLRQVSIYAV